MERYLMDEITIKLSWEIYLSNDEIAHNTAQKPRCGFCAVSWALNEQFLT